MSQHLSPAKCASDIVLLLTVVILNVCHAQAQDDQAACPVVDRAFADDVWSRVLERSCVRCHQTRGEAADSELLLEKVPAGGERRIMSLHANHLRLQTLARKTHDGESYLLRKIRGELDHGGGAVLQPDSMGYRILSEYARTQTDSNARIDTPAQPVDPKEFLAGVAMISPARHLRRMTLSLAGRLPTPQEAQQVADEGQSAIPNVIDALLQEEAFYDRLKEGFNDIFLTIGIEDNAETLLSYHHFEKTRLWYQHHDYSSFPEAERQRAEWRTADVYRDALLREPFELIAWIVKNDRPFSEIVTADYIMVSPYTARGYGIFEEIRGQFRNPEDPFEYIPAKLNALKGRDGKVQESPTGKYPHAGLLSMFHYLRRYPSTETNRNRLRARMVYQHFLGVDIMQLAPRTADAAAVSAKYEHPTMQAPDCVVCHRTIDPVAGVFQDFDFEGHLGPRKDGWYTDMFSAGYEGEQMPAEERWRAGQWLGERLVRDPRFAIAMTEHVYYILFGRKVLQPPQDPEDPMFLSRYRAFLAQRMLIENGAAEYAASGGQLKSVFRYLLQSDFYRVDGKADSELSEERLTELDDAGLVRMLSPEQLERKIGAIFGKRWGRLQNDMKILYGGIDSITVTERNLDPGGAMGAIQRLMANDVACEHVARDFRLPAEQRRLFEDIEPGVVPGDDMSNRRIRSMIVSLHQKILGQEVTMDSPEVEQTWQLFTGIIADAAAQGKHEPRETYFCGGREEFRAEDPFYTLRAWRAVVTFLLRQHDFLYE